ncbi:hypothetical protein [Solidesulfovibrio carbinolicus]|uniref:hypothetical protein n=1 Tax=Solidesulfovibrio carbinolicus TaxID=296842 RepID=UPI001010FD48|nr:hypothetical protein [Solidesulfovibrio carbinolicus]
MQLLTPQAQKPVNIPGFRHPSQILTYSGVDKDFVYDSEKKAFVCSNEAFSVFWEALEDRYDDAEAHKRELGTPWPYEFTCLFNESPISKAFYLEKGEVKRVDKKLNVYRGTAEKVGVYSLRDYTNIRLSGLTNQALQYSVCDYDIANIIMDGEYQAACGDLSNWNPKKGKPKTFEEQEAYFANGLPIIARTGLFFDYAWRPGILALDFDNPMPEAEALEKLYKAAPALRYAPHAVYDSTSTYIYHKDKMLRGGGKYRVVFLVTNATHIGRAIESIFKRAIINGDNFYKWSKDAQIKPDGLIDKATGRKNQIDYTSAVCIPPLEQKRLEPRYYNESAEPVNLRYAAPSLSKDEEEAYAAADEEARARLWECAPAGAVKPEPRKTKPQTPKTTENKAPRSFRTNIVERGKIDAGTIINTEIGPYSWRKIMENKEKFHGMNCENPVRPGNDARIYTLDKPGVWSFVDNGTYYPAPALARDIARAKKAEKAKQNARDVEAFKKMHKIKMLKAKLGKK